AACRKSIDPKFASGRTRQRPELVHVDGASATHSAEVRSGAAIVSFLFTTVCRVRFRMRMRTVLPVIVTAAEIRSPGAIAIFRKTGAAGKTSYQASSFAVPADVQLDSVPICSSDVAASVMPPSPTQKAEYDGVPATQVTAGCTHVPITFEKDVTMPPGVGVTP